MVGGGPRLAREGDQPLPKVLPAWKVRSEQLPGAEGAQRLLFDASALAPQAAATRVSVRRLTQAPWWEGDRALRGEGISPSQRDAEKQLRPT